MAAILENRAPGKESSSLFTGTKGKFNVYCIYSVEFNMEKSLKTQ